MMTPSVATRAELAHGYTMARVDRLADYAVNKASALASSVGWSEARQVAWSAIVDLLYLTPEKPTEWSLIDAGKRAINDCWLDGHIRARGLKPDRENGGYVEAPKFHAYWVFIVGPRPDWTDAIIERMALPRVLGVLTPLEYDAVITLAAHGTMAKAAEALGVDYGRFKQRVHSARKRMLAAWFDDETPLTTSKAPAAVACRYGHSRDTHGYEAADGTRQCRLCKRNASRRRAARAPRGGERLVSAEETAEAPLAFPPLVEGPPVGLRTQGGGEGPVLGSTACWCGDVVGHEWPGKSAGCAHPVHSVSMAG